VNGGLARSGFRRAERRRARRAKRRSRVGLSPVITVQDRQRPRVTRECHPAVASSPKRRCGSRGTGAVMATGSYEGSPPTEGIPGQLKRLFSRRGVDAGLGGPLSLDLPVQLGDKRRAVPHEREGARSSGARVGGDRDVRGSVFSVTVGRTSPRSCTQAARQRSRGFVPVRRSAEAVLGRRENVRSPGQVARSPSLRETPTRRKSR